MAENQAQNVQVEEQVEAQVETQSIVDPGMVHPSQAHTDKIKVMVCYPRGSFTMMEAVDNQMSLAFYLGQLEQTTNYKFYIGSIGRLFVPKAREEFAEMALDSGCDFLMMIDDDMLVPHDLFTRLMQHACRPDVDIIAPLAFQRRAPYHPVIYRCNEGWDSVRKERYFANEVVMNYPKDTLFRCDAVGFGAVLIKRWVLEKMQPPRFMSSSPTGEDILFCYNAREQLGAKVWVDTSTKIGHLGSPIVADEELYEQTNRMEVYRDTHGDFDYEQHKEGV